MTLTFAWTLYAAGLLLTLFSGLRWIVKNDPSYQFPTYSETDLSRCGHSVTS